MARAVFAFATNPDALNGGRGDRVAGMTYWRRDWDKEAAQALLAVHRLGQTGLEVTLDRGFDAGVYGITVDYGEAAQRLGFSEARRQARHYAARLHEHLACQADGALDPVEDHALRAAPGRKRDLESTFLRFDLTFKDQKWRDDDIKEQFRIAVLQAEQEWDQHQAGVNQRRQEHRRTHFRARLEELLEGKAYQQLDGALKERLLAEVTELVFPPRGRGL